MCMLVCKNPISESIDKEKNSNNNNVFFKEIEILRHIKKKKKNWGFHPYMCFLF